MNKIDELRQEYRQKVGSTYNMKYEWYADWLETQLLIERERVKNLTIPDVVQQSEQFKAIVFKMANMLAVAGKGDQAVQMHRIHNSL